MHDLVPGHSGFDRLTRQRRARRKRDVPRDERVRPVARRFVEIARWQVAAADRSHVKPETDEPARDRHHLRAQRHVR